VKGDGASKGDDASKEKPAAMARRMSRMSKEDMVKMAKMQVTNKWGTPRRLTDDELKRARTIFFDMDDECEGGLRTHALSRALSRAVALTVAPVCVRCSGSGDLDAEEIGKMMRKLGQDPTETEIRELINSVDSGDMDGKLQMREFLLLFALGLDSEGNAKQSDVTDCFMVFGGDPRDDVRRAPLLHCAARGETTESSSDRVVRGLAQDATIEAQDVDAKLLEDFGLDVNVKDVFGVASNELKKGDMERMIMLKENEHP
jgi:Ca2+-binding EF-hand superfamily protein